jgi:hypothetical protein
VLTDDRELTADGFLVTLTDEVAQFQQRSLATARGQKRRLDVVIDLER